MGKKMNHKQIFMRPIFPPASLNASQTPKIGVSLRPHWR